MDYNEIAAYLESLQKRLDQYKTRRFQNTLLGTSLIAASLIFLLIGRTFPTFFTLLFALLLGIAVFRLGQRMWRTNAEAAELEDEVGTLRYRLVADDIILDKSKRKRESRLELNKAHNLGQVQVGDDGELVITPAADDDPYLSDPQ